MRTADRLGVEVPTTADGYLSERLKLLKEALDDTNRLAGADGLQDVRINDMGLKISPLEDDTPPEAKLLKSQTYGLLPHVKITDLLLEVDPWTNFTRHFTHLKTAEPAVDRALLLTAILADAFNSGLEKMAEACPGTSLSKLAWLVAWHIRDESYSKALAELVNAQHKLPFAAHWAQGPSARATGSDFERVATENPPATATPTSVTRPMYSMDCCITNPSCDRRALHRNRRVHRPGVRALSHAWVRVRAPDCRSRR